MKVFKIPQDVIKDLNDIIFLAHGGFVYISKTFCMTWANQNNNRLCQFHVQNELKNFSVNYIIETHCLEVDDLEIMAVIGPRKSVCKQFDLFIFLFGFNWR